MSKTTFPSSTGMEGICTRIFILVFLGLAIIIFHIITTYYNNIKEDIVLISKWAHLSKSTSNAILNLNEFAVFLYHGFIFRA